MIVRGTLEEQVEYFGTVAQTARSASTGQNLGQGAETIDDERALARVFGASDGVKAKDLWEGRWQSHYGSQSQSEADLALVNIIYYYSKNRAQTERIFRSSPIYRPETYDDRQDLIDRLLNLAADRDIAPVDISAILPKLAEVVEQAKVALPDDADMPPIIDARDFADRPFRPRQWLVDGLMPERTVTLFSGDGGIGKSTAAEQLGFAVATGRRWLGTNTRAGSCLFITAEDEADDLQFRLAMTCRHEGMSFRDIPAGRLSVWSFAGHDALLAVPAARGGTLIPTPLFGAIRAKIEALRPSLVVLDTSADLFGGEENNRTHVRQFVSMLRSIAIEFDTAILLLSHPSLTGITNGSGLSGSTAWNNSVRARLYMKRDETDPAITILSVMKSNYGPTGEQIRCEFRDGVFVALGRDKDANAHRLNTEQSADDLFLLLVAEFNEREHRICQSYNSPTNFAPKLFSKHPKNAGFTVRHFQDAMVRLFSSGAIEIEKVGRWKDKMKDNIVLAPTSNSLPTAISE